MAYKSCCPDMPEPHIHIHESCSFTESNKVAAAEGIFVDFDPNKHIALPSDKEFPSVEDDDDSWPDEDDYPPDDEDYDDYDEFDYDEEEPEPATPKPQDELRAGQTVKPIDDKVYFLGVNGTTVNVNGTTVTLTDAQKKFIVQAFNKALFVQSYYGAIFPGFGKCDKCGSLYAGFCGNCKDLDGMVACPNTHKEGQSSCVLCKATPGYVEGIK
jgi:hypothetical protein